MGTDAESRWLLDALAYLCWSAFVALSMFWPGLDLPAEKVGNAYQLLGLFIAALAIPVLSPALARVERRIAAMREAIARWRAVVGAPLRRWWKRLLRRPPKTVLASLRGRADGTSSMSATPTTGYTGDTRQLAIRALDEVQDLRQQLLALQSESRQETQQRMEALRTDLHAHVSSVTREGWYYVVVGAVVTAGGIVITLAA
jgi:hypothetical protein